MNFKTELAVNINDNKFISNYTINSIMHICTCVQITFCIVHG